MGDTTWFSSVTIADSVHWTFGDGTSESGLFHAPHVFSDTGTFAVQLLYFFFNDTDTVHFNIRIHAPAAVQVPVTDTLCQHELLFAQVSGTSPSLLWSTGHTADSIAAPASGTYWVRATNVCDTVSDTIVLSVHQPLIAHLGADTHVCEGTALVLKATTDTTATVSWSTGQSGLSIAVDYGQWPAGTYTTAVWAAASNACGADSDTLQITLLPLPSAALGPDTVQCVEAPVTIARPDAAGVNYLWPDTTDAPAQTLTQSDTLWLSAANACGTDTDTVVVRFYPPIGLEKPSDTAWCGQQWFSAYWPGATYRWSTGDGDSAITVSSAGTYTVTVSHGPCRLVLSRVYNDGPCEPCEYSIPNTFSPNADGLNDALVVASSCSGAPFTVQIFNRWGQVVYAAQSVQGIARWDGQIGAAAASPGPYYLEVQCTDERQHPARASVWLWR